MSDMTAEERAASLANRCAEWSIDVISEEISHAEQAAAVQARAEEREACAVLADRAAQTATASTFRPELAPPAISMAETLAAAIRARSTD